MKPPLCMILPLLLQASFMMLVTATDCRSALGVESGVTTDDQFSASSSSGSLWQPWEARLNSNRAWIPRSYSTNEWLQVDMLERTSITGIQTQGHLYFQIGRSYYVTSYKLMYSDDGSNWNIFQENGSDKVFQGNRDANGVKTNTIDPPIVTRFIRLMPVTWQMAIAFRLELLGCELESTSTLKSSTMQTMPSSSVIPYSVSSITSGSEVTSPFSTDTSGNSDGLAGNPAGTTSGAIFGGAVVAGVVIIIITSVVSIFCMGRRRSKDSDGNESSPQPDETERTDRIYNNAVMFTANGNASNNGDVSIGRIKGATSSNVAIDQSQETISMENVLYAHAGATSGTTDQSQDMVDNNLYADIRLGASLFPGPAQASSLAPGSQPAYQLANSVSNCRSALGVESGLIRDEQFSASSSYGSPWQPWEARLNSGSAWYPSSYTTREWLQVDLLKRTSITGIKTQGDLLFGRSYYVTSFKLLYSDDGTTLNYDTYQENGSDKIFEGNRNANGVKTNYIDPPIVTRFIRLMAVTWTNGIAFRLELLGCELEPTTTSAAMPTTVTLPTTELETTMHISITATTLKTTTMQTTSSPSVTTYSVSSTKETSVTPEGITLFTPAVPQRSTSKTSGPGVISLQPTNTSGNSDGLAGNPAGNTLGAIIGGAVAAGVVIIIITSVVSIFCIRKRRSKDTDGDQSSPQPDKTRSTDRIYNNAVMFTANGNASNNGNVSIGQIKGATNYIVTIDQSEETMENDLYAYAGATSGTTGQSQDMVDNNLYASIRGTFRPRPRTA
ncbi:uncharacterized protein LOC144918500 [Branchiostoma floridae x Branchiostoma belcheri]